MATPQQPLTPEERLAREQKARYDKTIRNLAIGGLIVCPAIALLPPRKLDLYTFALGVGTYLSADQLCESYTGRGLVSNLTPRWAATGLPTDKAIEMQRILQEKKAAEERERRQRESREALRQGREDLGENANKGVMTRLWMGEEKEGWKEKRLEEERQALAEGKGYADLILEQIWGVWNWDKKKEQQKNGEDETKKP